MKTKKTFISVFAIIALVAVLVVSCVACQQIKDGADKAKDKVNELVDKAKDKVNNLELAVENNPRLSLAMADNSAEEEDSYVVTATFNTDFEELKKATWSLSFADTTVTENVENYVTKTTSEDTLSCTVKMVKPFDKVIILTCKNETYSNISANCQLDCKARLKDNAVFDFDAVKSGTFPNNVDQRIFIGENDNYCYSTSKINRMPCFGYSNMSRIQPYLDRVGFRVFSSDYSLSDDVKQPYTIDRAITISYLVKPSAELYSAFVKYGIAKSSSDAVDITSSTSTASPSNTGYYALSTILTNLIDTSKISLSGSSEDVNKFTKAVYSCKNNEYDGEIIIRAVTDYESKDYSFKFKFDISMIAGEDVVGVEVDNSNIAF